MAVDVVADAYYRRVEVTARTAAAALLDMWGEVGPSGFRGVLDGAGALLAAAQVSVAVSASDYVAAVAFDAGAGAPDTAPLPRSFAGATASGADVRAALAVPVRRSWELLAAGLEYEAAGRSGGALLTRVVPDVVRDTARDVERVATTTYPGFGGWVRRVRSPSCGRCLILAGRFYPVSDGFARHPGCDCFHVPVSGRDDAATVDGPFQVFDSMTPAQQERALGVEGARAVRDGADPVRVVNAAQRGANSLTKPGEGWRRRGRGGRWVTPQRPGGRLTVSRIYELSGGDREVALRLLRANDYVLGG